MNINKFEKFVPILFVFSSVFIFSLLAPSWVSIAAQTSKTFGVVTKIEQCGFEYKYRVDNKTYTDSMRVSNNNMSLNECQNKIQYVNATDKTVIVNYSPSNPQNSRVGNRWMPLLLIPIVCFTLMVLGVYQFWRRQEPNKKENSSETPKN